MKAEEFLNQSVLEGFENLDPEEQKKVLEQLKQKQIKAPAKPQAYTPEKSILNLG